jgi:hypothetical protein
MFIEISTSSLSLAAAIGGLPLAIYCIYNYYFHPLAGIPGPLSARLGFSTWRLTHHWCGTYAWSHKALHDRYGPVVRTGPNLVTTTNAEAVRLIYGNGTGYEKTAFYSIFGSFVHATSITSG